MAAAFALGAEGVQMGMCMVSAAESPVHDNYSSLHCCDRAAYARHMAEVKASDWGRATAHLTRELRLEEG